MKLARSPLLACVLAGAIGCSKAPAPADPPPAEAPPMGSTTALIAPDAAQKAGIETAEAGPARLRETLTLYGSIKPNAEHEQDIRARYPGVVRAVAKRAGDTVSKGDVLVTVESNESLQVYAIKSPLKGQVLDRSVNPGDAVDGSAVLMKVADLSTVWAEFQVFARDLSHVRPGMAVLFADADADKTGEVRISYVAPAGHADSQSVIARAVVPNRGGRWVPGQFINGDVVTTDLQTPVAVQPSALQELRGKTMVFVQTERGFEPREVEVGRRARDAIEILTGLAAGERYAAKNSYLIKADLLKSEADED